MRATVRTVNLLRLLPRLFLRDFLHRHRLVLNLRVVNLLNWSVLSMWDPVTLYVWGLRPTVQGLFID